MKINCRDSKKGPVFSIGDKEFRLEYPENIWKDYPENLKKIFVDNFAFLKAIHLPQMLNKKEKLDFATSSPLFERQFLNCMINNIPFCADVDNLSASEKLRDFMNLEYTFKKYNGDYPPYEFKLEKKAIVTMSFGKDSLLTFGLAKELGLDPMPVFMRDYAVTRENVYKKEVVENFTKEMKTKVWTFENETGVIHDYRYWKLPRTEWGYGHLITEFCLDLLPFAHHHKAKYILLANEKSCDDKYIGKEGYLCYPVFDQSSNWGIELSRMTKALTNNQTGVSSFIEPLYELAIIKILHNRYPEIGKYQMSCFPDENDYGKNHYWCEHCSKCARIYIFMIANKLDPKTIGFKTNMLTLENENLFSCFGVEKKEGHSVGYDASGCGNEEQIYAFYLAYNNGTRGPLMEKFRKNLYEYAKAHEKEYHDKYFGIHESKTIPEEFIGPLHNIFKKELEK